MVTDYLEKAGVTEALDTLGFQTVGYGCTTCIGNSGPLPEPVAKAVTDAELDARRFGLVVEDREQDLLLPAGTGSGIGTAPSPLYPVAGCINARTSFHRFRHARKSGHPEPAPGLNRGPTLRTPPWIPACAGMTGLHDVGRPHTPICATRY